MKLTWRQQLLFMYAALLRRWYYTYATLQSTPTYTCFVGTTTQAYGNFFGNTSSWSHITTWATYYNTTAPTWHAWSNTYACSSVQPAICEIPVAAYACASTPPPTPPPPPPTPPCECIELAGSRVALHADPMLGCFSWNHARVGWSLELAVPGEADITAALP
jgi:hypothetical protein